ncbi:two-component system, sensor histidine kinase YesM [Paenibacillus catalpae]|uniref:histidine kinase n=1 Tax=Paenibacillus catalpae TaxID=1045775 RepID=A0A1I1XNV1_9BACL|nr:sensor histidine kinase [Paenibacillus catalpae]SFE08328.1 two-component system, sensor histidine kinase YesM [Paenibacillus catalpae]
MRSFSLTSLLRQYRPRRLRTRILLAVVLLSVPPLIILGTISVNISKDTIVHNHLDNNEHNLKTASEVADLLFRNVINMHRLILANDQLREELKASAEDGGHMLDIRTANRLQNLVVRNLIDTRHIDSICLFDRGYHSVCYGSVDANAGIYEDESSRAMIGQTDWYKSTAAANGKEVFFSYNVLQSINSDTTGQSFSSVKLLRDPANFRPIGLLVINLKSTIFEQAMNDEEDSGFVVLDTGTGVTRSVYSQNPSISDLIDREDGEARVLQNLHQHGYLTVGYRNSTTDWTFLHVVKAKVLLQDSNRITTVTMLIAAIIALVAILLSLFVSGSITRPLLQLKKMMVDWSKGSGASVQVISFEEDEVGAIGETFRKISSENKQLSERLIHSQLKEKEAELRTLQAQIKPHFLYNTLDSIYWMAILQNNKDIAKMTVALSESFKISLNKGKETIPVFRELEHIEHYMTIQNLRYKSRFRYSVEVDEALMGIEILKLILQPLVENAIYHGLEPKIGEGTIRLTGRMEESTAIFTVEDDGVGMEDVRATETGYGLVNVRERIMLYYGDRSSLQVSSEPGKGTIVEIRFRPNEFREG